MHLIIKIDGITHNEEQKYDEEKERKLREIGLEVMRFNGYYIINHISETLEMISDKIRYLERITTPYPPFLRGGIDMIQSICIYNFHTR